MCWLEIPNVSRLVQNAKVLQILWLNPRKNNLAICHALDPGTDRRRIFTVFLLHIFIQPVKFQLFLGLILCSAMIF